jgi:AcrR family transcriptional regulator
VGRPQSDNFVGGAAILQSTIQLLKVRRPEQLSIADVARAARVTRPLVRYYFGDLDNLLQEVTDFLMADLQERMRISLEKESTLFLKIRSRLELRLQFMREHPNFERLASRGLSSEGCGNNNSLEVTVERGMALTRELLHGLPECQVDLRHLHVAIVGFSAYLETGEPVIELLFGSGSVGQQELAKFLDFFADMLTSHIQRAADLPNS